MDDFVRMTDEDLAERCKRNRMETWLHDSGCFVGLFVGLLACTTIIVVSILEYLPWSWCFGSYLALIAFPISVFSVYGLFEWMARFRCRHLLRELEGRYGCRPLAEYVKAMRKEIGASEIALILVGRTLPLCQNWWVCIRITDGKSTGSVEARFGPIANAGEMLDFGAGHNPKDSFRIATGELDPAVAGRLAELAGKIRKRKIDVPSTVIDGFPVSFAVVIGATNEVRIISCNLAGIPETQNNEPHILLAREAFSTGRVLIDAPSGFGSTNFKTGEIQIGGV